MSDADLLRRAAALMRERAEAATPGPWHSKVRFTDDCWEWIAGRSGSGYGRYWLPAPAKRFVQAHRFAYEALVGPIPEGHVLDHLCRNRGCVRPDHLEPVTQAENTRRGKRGRLTVACAKGHTYTPQNTYWKASGQRDCRECRRLRKRKDYRRERIAAA